MKKTGFTLIGLTVIVAVVLIICLLATWATPKLIDPERNWREQMAVGIAQLITEGSRLNAEQCATGVNTGANTTEYANAYSGNDGNENARVNAKTDAEVDADLEAEINRNLSLRSRVPIRMSADEREKATKAAKAARERELSAAKIAKARAAREMPCIRLHPEAPSRGVACDPVILSAFLAKQLKASRSSSNQGAGKITLTNTFPANENDYMIEGAGKCTSLVNTKTTAACTLRPYKGEFVGANPPAVPLLIYCTN